MYCRYTSLYVYQQLSANTFDKHWQTFSLKCFGCKCKVLNVWCDCEGCVVFKTVWWTGSGCVWLDQPVCGELRCAWDAGAERVIMWDTSDKAQDAGATLELATLLPWLHAPPWPRRVCVWSLLEQLFCARASKQACVCVCAWEAGGGAAPATTWLSLHGMEERGWAVLQHRGQRPGMQSVMLQTSVCFGLVLRQKDTFDNYLLLCTCFWLFDLLSEAAFRAHWSVGLCIPVYPVYTSNAPLILSHCENEFVCGSLRRAWLTVAG